MKKLLLLLALCISFTAANAQVFKNFSGCDVQLIPFCYDGSCTQTWCPGSVFVPGPGTVPLNPCCVAFAGYRVRFLSGPCTGAFYEVCDNGFGCGTCTAFPTSQNIGSGCSSCFPCNSTPTLSWVGSDLVLQ
jgi:hypothetical protein